MTGLVARLVVTVALLLASRAALAHEVGVSRGTYVLVGATVEAEVTLSRREISGIVEGLDVDEDGSIAQAELDRPGKSEGVGRAIAAGIEVRGDGAPCPAEVTGLRLAEDDGIVLTSKHRCAARPQRLTLDFPLTSELAFGHRHVAHVEAGGPALDAVVHRHASTLDMQVGDGAAPAPPEATSSVAWSFFVSGIEHILGGIDHLAFLFGLVLLGGRLRPILLMITAFTVAHSITLALAVLGIWAPSAEIIEPAIALSVAYVGVENWFVKSGDHRWRITLPFGLVHGFGFAGALGEIHLPSAQLPVALVTFNLGVEVGQVSVLALLLPLVLWARKRAWFRDVGVKALSAVVALAGCVWFVARVAGAL